MIIRNSLHGIGTMDVPTFDVDPAAAGGTGGQAAPAAPPAGSGQPDPGAAPAATGAPTPSPSGSSQPGADLEQLVEIKVGGQVEKVPLREALSLAQQGRDYTRKTQQLSDERRRFETDRETILRQEREKWQRELQEQERRKTEGQQDPGTRALTETQRLQARFEDEKLDAAVQAVRQQHPDANEREMLLALDAQGYKIEEMSRGQLIEVMGGFAAQHVKSAGEAFDKRLEEIFTKGEHPRLKKHEEAVIARYLKEKEAKPAPVTGSSGLPAGAEPPKKPRTMNEASEYVLATYGDNGVDLRK